MFWWIVLAAFVTFGAAIVLKITRISTLSGGVLAVPFLWLFFGFKENEASRAATGTFGSLFAAFTSCFAGLLLGSLILCRHTPAAFYWILCVPIVGVLLMTQFVLASHPIPCEKMSDLYMEAWPNLTGSVAAVVACYFVAGPWFK